MGLTDFVLNCEVDNIQLRKDLEYYKKYNARLKNEKKQLKQIIKNAQIELVKIDYDKFVYTKTALKSNKERLLQILAEVKDVM